MIRTFLPGDVTRETFQDEAEYNSRLNELYRTMGKRKIFYQGWIDGQLVIMYR